MTLLAALLIKVVDDVEEDAELWGHSKMNKEYFGFSSAFPITLLILVFNFGVLLDLCVLVALQVCASPPTPAPPPSELTRQYPPSVSVTYATARAAALAPAILIPALIPRRLTTPVSK